MKTLITSCAMMVLSASMASAVGLNLSWDDCGAAGAANKSFACDTNSGLSYLYGSFVPPDPYGIRLAGIAGHVSVVSSADPIPPWWQYGAAPACRGTNIRGDFNMPCASPEVIDYWDAVSAFSAGYAYHFGGELGSNKGEFGLGCGVPLGMEGYVFPPLEYYGFTIRLLYGKTVGSGSCEGCLTRVCLHFHQLELYQRVGLGDYVLTNAELRSAVAWQGATIGDDRCPEAVPTKNTTWGSVKALYR